MVSLPESHSVGIANVFGMQINAKSTAFPSKENRDSFES